MLCPVCYGVSVNLAWFCAVFLLMGTVVFLVLLVVKHGTSGARACWPLGGARSYCWDTGLWESSICLVLHGSRVFWLPNTLDSGVPPQNVKPESLLEHQDSASNTAQKGKRKKERNRGKNQTNLQTKENRQANPPPSPNSKSNLHQTGTHK